MNCNQCLGTSPILCAPLHAALALGGGIARLWRATLESLARLG